MPRLAKSQHKQQILERSDVGVSQEGVSIDRFLSPQAIETGCMWSILAVQI